MPSADTIILGGDVVTGTGTSAEAVAVTGERITAVGSQAEVLDAKDAATEVVDLRGAALLPGFIEPHTHPELSAQCYSWVDVSGFTHSNVESVEKALRDAVEAAEAGRWIFAFGLDPMLTSNLGTWDRRRLDRLAPDNPVSVMTQSMHTLFVNSAALRAAGVDSSTPDPAGGGRFMRDESGEPNGIVVEQPAAQRFMSFLDLSLEAWIERLRDQYVRYRSAGITTVGIAGVFTPRPLLPMLEEVTTREEAVRAVAYRHHALTGSDWKPSDETGRFELRGVKLWYDGSPYSGTMLLDDPYLDSDLCCETLGISPGTNGHANIDSEELVATLQEYRDRGWQVLTHAQGDRGTREVLDAYEKVLEGHTASDHRWRLEHCALISRDDVVRAAKLGVALSFHVNHVYYYGPELRESIIGSKRAEAMMPIGSAVRAGHRISLHADSPMYPANPLSLMKTAVTRLTRAGDKLGAEEAISTEQALRAVTIDAAWQLFADGDIGSIETGKLADFVILERNPLNVAGEELVDIEVLDTWLAGRPKAV
jgi:hypothetical protein